MRDLILCLQDWQIVVVFIGFFVGLIESVRRMIGLIISLLDKRTCNKIIHDFNILWPEPKPCGNASWMYMLTDKKQKYRLSRRKALRCIKYFKENGFIRMSKEDGDPTTYWMRQ